MTNVEPKKLIRFRPSMGLTAIQERVAGGWRLWLVARHLDKQGAGYVDHSNLFNYLVNELGVARQNFGRWLKEAQQYRFFKKVILRGKDKRYILTGETIAAAYLGLERVDKRYMVVQPAELFQRGWRKKVWEGYIATHLNGKVISRNKIQEITGFNRQKQIRLEKGINVVYIHNYWQTDFSGNLDKMCAEFGVPAISHKGKLLIRLPDSRVAAVEPEQLPCGRARHINRALKHMVASSKSGAGAKKKCSRMFYPSIYEAHEKLRKSPYQQVWYQRKHCTIRNHPVQVWRALYKNRFDLFVEVAG